MHKKIILFSVLIVLGVAAILILTQQPDARFEGERISDQGSFALRFDRMNMTDSETLVLREGDALHVSWQIESGHVDIVIRQKNEEPVYQADDRAAGDKADFYVEIPQTGSYTITVSSREAKGQISFLKRTMNNAIDALLLDEICSPMIPEEQYAAIVNGGV